MNFSYLKLWICYCSGRSRNVKKGWLGTCWEKVLMTIWKLKFNTNISIDKDSYSSF